MNTKGCIATETIMEALKLICPHPKYLVGTFEYGLSICCMPHFCTASDFFQDWWAEMTHGAKNGGLFSEMMAPSISN